jgi:hypothetical protein
MKGKEIMNFIKENRLEDYDVKLKLCGFKGEKLDVEADITGKYIDEDKKVVVLLVVEDDGLTQKNN